jgi:Mg2+ and Co2+ transporter CorA
MCENVIQNLSAVLYNRINKCESSLMKTIAVVTVLFLPATFISAVFASGVFNLHGNEEPGRERVVSRNGWIYLTVCLLLSAVTLGLWTCWYLWGGAWLESGRRKRMPRPEITPGGDLMGHTVTGPDLFATPGIYNE